MQVSSGSEQKDAPRPASPTPRNINAGAVRNWSSMRTSGDFHLQSHDAFAHVPARIPSFTTDRYLHLHSLPQDFHHNQPLRCTERPLLLYCNGGFTRRVELPLMMVHSSHMFATQLFSAWLGKEKLHRLARRMPELPLPERRSLVGIGVT